MISLCLFVMSCWFVFLILKKKKKHTHTPQSVLHNYHVTSVQPAKGKTHVLQCLPHYYDLLCLSLLSRRDISMGAYLSSPVTDKISCDKSCTGFTYGASSMQGWRISQEVQRPFFLPIDQRISLFLFCSLIVYLIC